MTTTLLDDNLRVRIANFDFNKGLIAYDADQLYIALAFWFKCYTSGYPNNLSLPSSVWAVRFCTFCKKTDALRMELAAYNRFSFITSFGCPSCSIDLLSNSMKLRHLMINTQLQILLSEKPSENKGLFSFTVATSNFGA